MEKDGTRQRTLELIASLECHIQALQKLPGHENDIESCKKAIENLRDSMSYSAE